MLDANAVLRFLLQDNEEQFQQVRAVTRAQSCYVTIEVLAEVCYVLEGLYQVPREDIVDKIGRASCRERVYEAV